jgi:lipoyl-dependent peroxiredoxin
MKVAAAKIEDQGPGRLSIDAQTDLLSGADGYAIRPRLNVSLPGLERAVAQVLIDASDKTCLYFKAIRGHVDAVINLV